MSKRFTRRSVIWRLPGGHRTAIRGPPSEILCYVDQTATAGTPHGRLQVTARSSADSRPQIGDCNVIARSSSDARAIIQRSSTLSPWNVLCLCTAFVNVCLFIKIYWMILHYNKHKVLFGVIFWELLPASCCLVSTKHSMIYKCCYVLSVLLALEWMYHAIDIISNMKNKKRLLWNLWKNSSTSIWEINKAFTDIVQQPFFVTFIASESAWYPLFVPMAQCLHEIY